MIQPRGRPRPTPLLLLAALAACHPPPQQQLADPAFTPAVARPAYERARGPRVGIDEAHHNFHTADGRYRPFAELLRADGYLVEPSPARLSPSTLGALRVLVVANAAPSPGAPSAFSDDEIAAVHDWVSAGGALLLIADHMPAPGAAQKLARAFGVSFSDGFALRGPDPRRAAHEAVFRASDGSLARHAITLGRNPDEAVTAVATFVGSAFHVDGDARPLLIFGAGYLSYTPAKPWQMTPETPHVPIEGWLQGAAIELAKGRVAVFGEAAMFSAQRSTGGAPMGMNAPIARQNAQLVLNVVHWLSGLL